MVVALPPLSDWPPSVTRIVQVLLSALRWRPSLMPVATCWSSQKAPEALSVAADGQSAPVAVRVVPSL